jgi:uncharacterized protein (TIGR03435 family)
MLTSIVLNFFLILTSASLSPGQDTNPSFDVASIKPNRSGAKEFSINVTPGGGLDAHNASLRTLIAFAYDVPESDVIGGPSRTDTERYDVVARADTRAPHAGAALVKSRAVALLAERFHLQVRRTTHDQKVAVLVIRKAAAGLKRTAAGSIARIDNAQGRISCRAVSMPVFVAQVLTYRLGRPVVDETQLEGEFDFDLKWTPEDGPAADAGSIGETRGYVPVADYAPALLNAMRRQLGLEVVTRSRRVPAILIERVGLLVPN